MSQGARHRAELAHKGTLASRQRPSLDGLKTQLSGSSLADTSNEANVECVVRTVSQPIPDTPVTVQLSPTLSPQTDSSPASPSKNPLMEELLAVQRRRGSSSNEEHQPLQTEPSVAGYNPSFQDQLKSKLEARKRSLEGGDHQEPAEQYNLPLSEVQSPSYKGK